MIIKSIKHGRMTNSIQYLYSKMENENAKMMPLFSTERTYDSFISMMKSRVEEHSLRTGKEIKLNSQIMHYVVALHGNDRKKFEKHSTDFIKEICLKLNIDPEDHGLTAFIHNDRAHPHIHLAFSKTGASGNVYSDSNNYNHLAKIAYELDHEYGLTKAQNLNIQLTRKEIYNPTTRGELIRAIDWCRKSSKTITEFQKHLHRIGVRTNKTKDNKLIYIFEGKAFPEDYLPKEARLDNLYRFIKTDKHPKELKLLELAIIDKVRECKTLNDLQNAFPKDHLYYEQKGASVYNIKLHTSDYIIDISSHIKVEPSPAQIQEYSYFNYKQIPLIFTPKYDTFDQDLDEQDIETIKQQRARRKINKNR